MSPTRKIARALLLTAGIVATGPAHRALGQDPPPTVPGIDVSHWQGIIDWDQVAGTGVAFAFCKATEGVTYTDPQFARNWAEMQRVGIVRGAYHYARPGSDPVLQAQHFCDVVQPAGGDLPMVLDLEQSDGQTAAQVLAWTQQFADAVEGLSGRRPIIYTGGFWKYTLGNPTDNFGCALWLAQWTSGQPTLPRAWDQWTFWQYSSQGSVPGITGRCDLDVFNGTLDDLIALAGGGPAGP